MSRPLRIEYPGAFYHAMNRGANRKPIFLDEGDRQLFLTTLKEAVRLWHIKVHAFSLMPNHYHLLLETPLGNLSRAMRHLDGVYTQRTNRKNHRDGPLFRGRFKSILVEKESYFLELVRYIHLNSVRAQIYRSPEADPYSSHRFYLGIEKSPVWLTTNLALSYFGVDPLKVPPHLDEFVRQGISPDLEKVLEKKRWPALLGSKNFIGAIKAKFIRNKPAEPEKPQDKEIRRLTPREVVRVVRNVTTLSVKEILGKGAENYSTARDATIYLLRQRAHLNYACLGKWVGLKKTRISEIVQKTDSASNPTVKKALDLLDCHRKTET